MDVVGGGASSKNCSTVYFSFSVMNKVSYQKHICARNARHRTRENSAFPSGVATISFGQQSHFGNIIFMSIRTTYRKLIQRYALAQLVKRESVRLSPGCVSNVTTSITTIVKTTLKQAPFEPCSWLILLLILLCEANPSGCSNSQSCSVCQDDISYVSVCCTLP